VRRRVGSLALELWMPIALVVTWWFWSEHSHSFFFPPLRKIMIQFRETWLFSRFASDLLPSLLRFAEGIAIAVVAGIGIGLLLGLWPLGRRATAPIVDFLRSVPAPALISVMIVLIGFGNGMKVTSIAFAAFFPTLLNTIDGVRGVDLLQIEMAQAYKVRRRDRIVRVVLPAASPQIFAGLRITLGIALAVMVFSEMAAGTNGLGHFIIFAQETYRIPDMWSGIIVLGLMGYAVNLAFLAIERRVMRWHRGWRAATKDAGAAV